MRAEITIRPPKQYQVQIFVASSRGKDGVGPQRSFDLTYSERQAKCEPARHPDTEGAISCAADTNPDKQSLVYKQKFLDDIRIRPLVFLFVHGYNNPEDFAINRAASLMEDLMEDLQASSHTVVFTWPSAAQNETYLYDLQSANFSRDELEQLIKDLSVNSQLRIFAHSMGCWLTMEALRQIALEGQSSVFEYVEDVFLIAPDIDEDVFETQLKQINPQKTRRQGVFSRDNLTRRITVVAGTDDYILQASGLLASWDLGKVTTPTKSSGIFKTLWGSVNSTLEGAKAANELWHGDIKAITTRYAAFITNKRVGAMSIGDIDEKYGIDKDNPDAGFGVYRISTKGVKATKEDVGQHFRAAAPPIVAQIRERLLRQPQLNQPAIASADGVPNRSGSQ